MWSIDQDTFSKFTVLEKTMYENCRRQSQFRKKEDVSELTIVHSTSDDIERYDNDTFITYTITSDMSSTDIQVLTDCNAFIKKLLSDEELCKYVFNLNDVERILFKYRI